MRHSLNHLRTTFVGVRYVWTPRFHTQLVFPSRKTCTPSHPRVGRCHPSVCGEGTNSHVSGRGASAIRVGRCHPSCTGLPPCVTSGRAPRSHRRTRCAKNRCGWVGVFRAIHPHFRQNVTLSRNILYVHYKYRTDPTQPTLLRTID